MAQLELARRGAGATLGPTTLLHETYLISPWRVRAVLLRPQELHGVCVASDAWAHHRLRTQPAIPARGRLRVRVPHGRHRRRNTGPTALTFVRDAMDALASVDARLALIVDLKFFCGFSLIEIAGMQGVSERTVQRDWRRRESTPPGAARFVPILRDAARRPCALESRQPASRSRTGTDTPRTRAVARGAATHRCRAGGRRRRLF